VPATGCAAAETNGGDETRWFDGAFIRRCLAKTRDKFALSEDGRPRMAIE